MMKYDDDVEMSAESENNCQEVEELNKESPKIVFDKVKEWIHSKKCKYLTNIHYFVGNKLNTIINCTEELLSRIDSSPGLSPQD